MAEYYDGTKLLSLKDINGKEPEIYAVTGNRTCGKTTYFARLLVNRWIKRKSKFMLVYRWAYENNDVADRFFPDIGGLFFKGHEMTSRVQGRGIYSKLYFDGENCGYACAVNCADNLKKISHLFNDVESMFFDEFMPESNKYCPNEIEKMISLHTSVARGHGKQIRRVPLYMASNAVTLLNPYYTAWGVSERIKNDTRFLRGNGLAVEQAYVKSAAIAQASSPFNAAFSENKYLAYSSQNVYLNDNYSFIEKPRGRGKYAFSVRYNGKNYGVHEYENEGIMYVTNVADTNFPYKFSLTTDDHNINYVMLAKNSFLLAHYRGLFEHGCFRFKNLECKQMILKLLSY